MKGQFYKNFIWIIQIHLNLNMEFYLKICLYNVFETLGKTLWRLITLKVKKENLIKLFVNILDHIWFNFF